jgi:hypothetical protein
MRQYFEELLHDQLCFLPKHADEPWYDVIQRDLPYVRWLLENFEFKDEELKEALEWGVDNVPERF